MVKKAMLFAFGLSVFAASVVLGPVDGFAQGGTPATLDKATVSAEVAKRTLVKAQLSATVARQLVDACLEFARNQQGGPGTYAIYVLAPNGDIIDAHVMDGVLPIGVETGLLKAKTALYARTPSSAVAQRFNTVDGRLIRLDLGKADGLAYYFVGGGLPIVVQDQLIGAIGVGGGNMDEQCAYQALTKVLGPQPPLPAPPAGGAAPEGRGRGRGQQ
ncbi:MAG: heme-binding protein [Acidobacteriota bacterium]